MVSLRFCTKCGNEVRPAARFCPVCGSALPEPGPETSPGAPGHATDPGGAASPSAPAESLPTLPPEAWRSQGDTGRNDLSATGQQTRNWSPTPTSGAPSVQPPYSPAAASGWVPPRRFGWPLLAALIAAVVLGAGVAVALVVLPSHPKATNTASKTHTGVAATRSSPATAPTTPAAAASATASVSALPTLEQAAQALAALLAQSGADRSEVTGAVSAVEDCSADLSQDEAIFSTAESSRQTLLSRLATLPGRSMLPASMLRDLTAAWNASSQADQDFVRWTQDEISGTCSTDDQADANFQASTGPDDQATRYKKAFARQWAPIATEYGLPIYQYNQI